MIGQGKMRAANRRSSIYLGKDGSWHGCVTMGVRDDGKPDRRHVRGKDKATVTAKVKSQAGRRGIALPDELFTLIMAHRTMQERERQNAGSEWHEGGWIFTQPNGKPIDPRRDQYEWKTLLAEAGVREARLHDARHTAATVLLLLVGFLWGSPA